MSDSPGKSLPLLALTGGIGSGKSTVAELFRAHGALVISADLVSRELLEPEAVGWRKIQAEFGPRFFTTTGQLDRAALRRAIFSDPTLRARLDTLLHPLIRARIGELVAGAARARWPVATRTPPFAGLVVEVPLLYEAGWQADFPFVVVVRSEEEQAIRRLMTRDQISRAEAQAALAAQLPLTTKLAQADAVIDNRGELAATARQVAELIARMVAGSGATQPSPAGDASPNS